LKNSAGHCSDRAGTRYESQPHEHLIEQCGQRDTTASFIGLQNGKFFFHDMRDFDRMADLKYQRPCEQWWLQLKTIANLMAKLTPES